MPLITGFHLDVETLTSALHSVIQLILCTNNSPPIKTIFLQFRGKKVVGYSLRDLSEVQVDDIHSFSPIH